MGLARRRSQRSSKLAAVRRLEQGVSIAEAARALEVGPNVLQRWRREFREGAGNVFPGNGKQRWSEGRIAELERKVGQQALEVDFLKGCLQRIEEQRDATGTDWKSAVYRKVQAEGKADRGLIVLSVLQRLSGSGRSCGHGWSRWSPRTSASADTAGYLPAADGEPACGSPSNLAGAVPP